MLSTRGQPGVSTCTASQTTFSRRHRSSIFFFGSHSAEDPPVSALLRWHCRRHGMRISRQCHHAFYLQNQPLKLLRACASRGYRKTSPDTPTTTLIERGRFSEGGPLRRRRSPRRSLQSPWKSRGRLSRRVAQPRARAWAAARQELPPCSPSRPTTPVACACASAVHS